VKKDVDLLVKQNKTKVKEKKTKLSEAQGQK
jgi:hypothetical protein